VFTLSFDVFRANGSQVEHHMLGRGPGLQGVDQDSDSGSETPATYDKAVEAGGQEVVEVGGKETIAELKE
jgi:hypothetical protein